MQKAATGASATSTSTTSILAGTTGNATQPSLSGREKWKLSRMSDSLEIINRNTADKMSVPLGRDRTYGASESGVRAIVRGVGFNFYPVTLQQDKPRLLDSITIRAPETIAAGIDDKGTYIALALVSGDLAFMQVKGSGLNKIGSHCFSIPAAEFGGRRIKEIYFNPVVGGKISAVMNDNSSWEKAWPDDPNPCRNSKVHLV
jgi:hypothetical protein